MRFPIAIGAVAHLAGCLRVKVKWTKFTIAIRVGGKPICCRLAPRGNFRALRLLGHGDGNELHLRRAGLVEHDVLAPHGGGDELGQPGLGFTNI